MDFRTKVDKGLSYLLIAIMGIMVINVLWQVISRYVLAVPSSFTDELARYLMIWLGVFGAAYVAGKNGHVAIDVLRSKFNKKVERKLKQLVSLLVLLFSLGALVIGGSRLVYITYVLGQSSPALQLPLALVYLALPLSGVLIIYYKIQDLRTL